MDKSGSKTADIRCAMTDKQYHEVCNQLSDVEGLLALVQPFVGDSKADLGMIVGLNLMAEKVRAAQGLMQAAWDRTIAARRA